MRATLAILTLVLVASCDGEDRTSPPPEPPPLPETPLAPRAAPREVPEFCQPLWNGLHDRSGVVTPYADERRYDAMTLAEARRRLETADTWTGAWVPGSPSDEGRAFHRVRESPDAIAHFEHLYGAGPGRVAALYATCGFAELDRDRYAAALATLRASEAQVTVSSGDLAYGSTVSEVVDDGAYGRLFVSPGGFLAMRRRDDFFADDPGRMQIVQSLDPFASGGDGSMRDIAARRILSAIQHNARLSEHVPPDQVFLSSWRANVEVRGDALEVDLFVSARERFAVRFTVDADTGEARDIRERQW